MFNRNIEFKSPSNMRGHLILTAAMVFFLFPHSTRSQIKTIADSLPPIMIFEDYRDTTIYYSMHQILDANFPISYLSPLALKIQPLQNRRYGGLRFGEGQNGYILEGIIDLQFVIMQGRPSSNNVSQTSRLSFRYAPGLRMTRDNSSNLLPPNQKIGLQLDKILWNNFSNSVCNDSYGKNEFCISKYNWPKQKKVLHMLTISALAMHYSNGQAAGVWLNDSAVLNRNDYIKGDFSTNILAGSFTYSYFNNYLLSLNIGFQKDADWGGPFSFMSEQNSRYGKNRITGYIQYLSSPKRNPFGSTMLYYNSSTNSSYIIDKKWEWRTRIEWEYIIGDLSRFPLNKKYRLGSHFYLEGTPMRSRSMGYVFHAYYGRDYFNIRYDDPIFALMAGVSFKLKKFKNPWFESLQTVIGRSYKTPKYIKRYEKRLKQDIL
jgi:hypothetical protein